MWTRLAYFLELDFVVNHTSKDHEWAQKVRHGNQIYQDHYYTFPNREISDMVEAVALL